MLGALKHTSDPTFDIGGKKNDSNADEDNHFNTIQTYWSFKIFKTIILR